MKHETVVNPVNKHCWHDIDAARGVKLCCFCGTRWQLGDGIPRPGHGPFDPDPTPAPAPESPCGGYGHEKAAAHWQSLRGGES